MLILFFHATLNWCWTLQCANALKQQELMANTIIVAMQMKVLMTLFLITYAVLTITKNIAISIDDFYSNFGDLHLLCSPPPVTLDADIGCRCWHGKYHAVADLVPLSMT